MPKLSVLMPVHNGGSFLTTALKSTLRALPRDAELVVLNDGSTDNTASDLERIKSGKLKVIHQKEPGGLVKALNALVSVTDSAYIARMDADDVCLPWRFTYQLRAAERSDFVFTSVVFINRAGRLIRPDFPGGVSSDAVPLHLLLGNFLVHPTMLAKRQSLLDAGAYRPSHAEDYDLWLRVANGGGRIERLAVPGLLYRRHDKQVSVSGEWKSRGSDPALDESFARLMRNAIGFCGDSAAFRLASIHGSSAGTELQQRQEFKRAIRNHSARLPLRQRLLLRGRLLQASRQWLDRQ